MNSALIPQRWVVVGPEYSKEEIKAGFLLNGQSLVGEAVTDVLSIALRITRVSKERVLSDSARQEVLRLLLAPQAIAHRLKETQRLKRQRGFFKRLDQALQSGRLVFSHWEELAVMQERLNELRGPSPLFDEMMLIGQLYENWLEHSSLWDVPRLLTEATRVLESSWPLHLEKPQEMTVMSHQMWEARETLFWERMSQWVRVDRSSTRIDAPGSSIWVWKQWHTLDDAAIALAEQLSENRIGTAVLIPDDPQVRRALMRAFQEVGLPLADPRDPTWVKRSEEIKRALQPISVVAQGFEREAVVSALLSRGQESAIQSIYEKGIRAGLDSFSQEGLSELNFWSKYFSGRKTLNEIASAHLEWISRPQEKTSGEVIRFFEGFWNRWLKDLELIGEEKSVRPLAVWWELLQERMARAKAPPPSLKPAQGVELYRLSQKCDPARERFKRIVFFGLSGRALEMGNRGYWFHSRERDALAGEFALKGSVAAHQERLDVLKGWVSCADEIEIADAEFDSEGRSREGIFPVLKELSPTIHAEPVKMGVHPRFLGGYSGVRTPIPSEIHLPPRDPQIPVSASELDHFSRCGFLGLGYHRWKLKDLEEPTADLPADIQGVLLHRAVELFVQSQTEPDRAPLTPEDAVKRAWGERPHKRMLQGERLSEHTLQSMTRVIARFAEEEQTYRQRAQVRILSLESRKLLSMEWPEGKVQGRPDRIDEHAEGIFVIDYKTSSALPTGAKMLGQGYRLQLPFYALAAHQAYGRPVLGCQFIELTRKGARSKGVFLKKYNGKTDGSLTQLRGNNSSLMASEPSEIWPKFEEQIREILKLRAQGHYAAQPKDPADCRNCALFDACGRGREIPLD